MDLKNITMSDLKAKFSGAADKKSLVKFGIGLGAIILFLIIYYAIINPMVKEKKATYEDKLLKQNEITQFENEIIQFKARIKKLKPEYEESSTLFHSKAEVEDLYQSLSKYAGVNGLVISKIEKKKPIPVLKEGIAQQAENLITKEMVSYYKIPVDYEIKGKFLGYIKFKRAVSKQNKMLNFDKETISVVQNDSTGAIIATGELTIVGLPNDFFRILFVLILVSFYKVSLADNHDAKKKEELVEQVKEINKEINKELQEELIKEIDDEVPLNDPFAGNEGANSMKGIPDEEQENEMSLYNFKLAGLISGKDYSFISIVNSAGEIVTLQLGQYIGKNQFIDSRLTEAIFKKEDGKYLILDFNNQITEADEY